MKILEINKYYFIKGGAEKHFFDVIDLLKNAGNDVAVFSMQHSENRQSGWNKYFISEVGYTGEYSFSKKIKGIFRAFYSLEAKKNINKVLDNFQPDVVHIHNIYHQLSPMILFEIKKRNIPIVMTIHDYKLINPNYNLFHKGKFYDRCRNGKFYQCFLDKCIKNSYVKSFIAMLEMYWHEFFGTYRKNIDRYIVPSEFTKNILIERGIDSNKIKILPHFINDEKNNPFEQSKENKEKYALFFGRIVEGKGIEDLIDIFKNKKDIKLYIAGNSYLNSYLIKSDNIKELGWLNPVMLKNYVRNAEFVISPSKLPETFGLVALESISQGVPFIGYDSGAYSEIIKNGENGYLANNKEELKNLIENISQLNSFNSEKIKKKAIDKYDKKCYYGELMKVFESMKK